MTIPNPSKVGAQALARSRRAAAAKQKPPSQRWNAAEATARANSWQNLLSGLGVKGVDRRLDTTYAPDKRLDEHVLRSMYRGDGFARRVVDLPVKEMLRRGFAVEGDPEDLVNARFEEVGIHQAVRKILRWSRLFGGGFGVLGLRDGGLLNEPLREAQLQSVEFLHAFDRYRVTYTSGDLYADANNPKFGRPEFYTVTPLQGGQFRVHETRTVIIDGAEISDQDRVANQGWGDSVLRACFDQLRWFFGAYGGAELIIEDFIQAVLSIKNLQEMLATPEGAALVKQRLELLDLSRHMLHIKLLDAEGEDYEKHASSVAGLADLMDRFAVALAGVTGIPATKLLGRSPAGLNATGESDITNWYDDLRADQEQILSPVYERLVRLVFLSRSGPFKGKEPEDWRIDWLPLHEPTEKERAEVYKLTAEGDNAYIQAGALDARDVRRSRFVAGFGGVQVENEEPPESGEDEE